MGQGIPTREEALNILHEFTQSENLRRHMHAVEAAMRFYAKKFGEDEHMYGVVGLLHDFDYEQWPDEHPEKGSEILTERGVNEEIRETILSHAEWTGVPRDTRIKKTLFACDEIAGFTMAVALVRPSKQLGDVKVKSITKKLNDRRFAENVSREEIEQGAAELELPLDEHIGNVLRAMQGAAHELGV